MLSRAICSRPRKRFATLSCWSFSTSRTSTQSPILRKFIQHLADFLLELGDDFAFVGRQRRLRIDDTWFRVDLVFVHRRLRCLVIIDLKVGSFSYADAGQMHLYLNYAREH
nr:PDDEXK nuclease domain-containing protein [Paraburkholderia dilworthii]